MVSLSWLKELVEMGRIPDTKVYITNQASRRGVDVAVEVEMVGKGKGKATTVELDGAMDLDTDKMQDITNSESLHQI